MANSSHNKKPILFLILSSVFGWFVALYSVWHRENLLVRGTKDGSFCSINSAIDCDTVALSRFAEILGFSTAGWGLIFYSVVLLTAVNFYFNVSDGKTDQANIKGRFLSLFSALGLVPTLLLAAYSFVSLKILCLICLAMYIANIFIFIYSQKSSTVKTSPVYDKSTLIAALVAAVLGFLVTPVVEFSIRGDAMGEKFLNAVSYSHSIQPQQNFDLDSGPSLGPKDAKVVIVEFSDFQCPFCALSARTVPAALKKFDGSVRIVYKNYPLDPSCNKDISGAGHSLACHIAKTGWCVFKKSGSEAFFSFKKEAFANQSEITRDLASDIAAKNGITKDELQSCLEDPSTHDAIVSQIAEGKAAQVRGTPSIFINGKNVPSGPTPFVIQHLVKSYL